MNALHNKPMQDAKVQLCREESAWDGKGDADATPRLHFGARMSRAAGPGVFAVAGVLGGMLASTCCIVPLLLVTLGVSGAWIGRLTALEPYKPYMLAVTALLLAGGFWRVYVRPRKVCAPDGFCAKPVAGHVTKAILLLGTGLAVTAATVNQWAPLLY